MKTIRSLAIMAFILSSAGCFPIDLDVNAKGEMIIPRQEGFFLYQPQTGKVRMLLAAGEGKPTFARFSPDGEQVLLIDEVGKDFSKEYRLQMIAAKGGEPRTIFKHNEKMLDVHFSPDGAQLLFIERGLYSEDEIPRLNVVDLKTGKSRLLTKKAAPLVRWFADSKRLLMVKVTDKDKETSGYFGQLCILDVNTAESSVLLSVLGDQSYSCMDFSPDRTKVVFTCMEAGPPDAKLKGRYSQKSKLFEYDLAKKTLRTVTYRAPTIEYARFLKLCGDKQFARVTLRGDRLSGQFMPGLAEKVKDDDVRKKLNGNTVETVVAKDGIEKAKKEIQALPGHSFYWCLATDDTPADDSVTADFFRYSPDGKRLLLTKRSEERFLEGMELMVADAGLTTFRTVATDAYTPFLWYGGGVNFPGWTDADHIFYLTQRQTYGTIGKALELTVRGADGTGTRVVQPDLDLAVLELVEKAGNK